MKTIYKSLLALTLLVAALSATAQIKPAVIFDMGGKFDKSFNESVYNGMERFKAETGIQYREFEITNPTQREQAIQRLARRSDIVLVVGFTQASALQTVAPDFPDVKFTIIDSVVDAPNVRSIVFKEHEGSFLVGMLAALHSDNAKVGFVGGMDIPLIRRFACGYEQGVKYINADARIYSNMAGTTPEAWSNPGKGAELARGQIDRGADVIYAAAGATGLGVLQAAADAGKLSIGVDSNQNHLHPGSVLTSMLKRVDLAAYNTMMAALNGSWQPGVQSLGIKEGGVGWSLDQNNAVLINADDHRAINAATEAIISGQLQVHDYMADNSCNI